MLTSFFSLMCFSFAPSWVVPDILHRRLRSAGLALTIFRNSLTFPPPHLTTPLGKTAASPQRLLALSHPKSVHHPRSRRLLVSRDQKPEATNCPGEYPFTIQQHTQTQPSVNQDRFPRPRSPPSAAAAAGSNLAGRGGMVHTDSTTCQRDPESCVSIASEGSLRLSTENFTFPRSGPGPVNTEHEEQQDFPKRGENFLERERGKSTTDVDKRSSSSSSRWLVVLRGTRHHAVSC